jgi:hypothetical protein
MQISQKNILSYSCVIYLIWTVCMYGCTGVRSVAPSLPRLVRGQPPTRASPISLQADGLSMPADGWV